MVYSHLIKNICIVIESYGLNYFCTIISIPNSQQHIRKEAIVPGQGAIRNPEWVSLTKDAMKAFKVLKQACMTVPILVFADYTEPFLLETNTSKDRLRVVLSKKQADGQYYIMAYGSRSLMPYEKNYHSTKLEFLVLKWVVAEDFKEYLLQQPFVVWMDNNQLMYIMSKLNLDAMGH